MRGSRCISCMVGKVRNDDLDHDDAYDDGPCQHEFLGEEESTLCCLGKRFGEQVVCMCVCVLPTYTLLNFAFD